ncbi:MAG: ABC-2 family transporter protein [Candidatus Nanohalobium sp.]
MRSRRVDLSAINFVLLFASFFPATFLLDKPGWTNWQIASIIAGPVFYLIAYRFWKFGLSRYSSTGS